MPDDPRLKMFLDEWQDNVRSGRTVASLHERFTRHEADDDERFDKVNEHIDERFGKAEERIAEIGRTLARDEGRREGEQTGRYTIVNGQMVRDDPASYRAPAPHTHAPVERRDSFRPARAIAKALLSPKVLPWLLGALGLVAGALIRHCAPGLAWMLPPPTLLTPPGVSAPAVSAASERP